MYNISENDKRILCRFTGMDDVAGLTMLKPETTNALLRARVEMIRDLARYVPFWLMGIDGVRKDEIAKLDVIYHFILDDAYGDLHG